MEKRIYSIGILLGILCIALAVFAGYLFAKTNELQAQLQTTQRSVNLPIGAEKAVEIAKSDPAFINFSSQYFKDPKLRIEQASLIKNESLGYVWKVEIIERKCGCEGKVTLNSMVIHVNPETGEVLQREKNIAVGEEQYARKSCELECHPKEKVGILKLLPNLSLKE